MKVSRKKGLPPVANMEAFLAVARSRSVTVAAEELFLTQGAVSRQIQDLEKFVGVNLFTRGSKGLELTAAGQQLAGGLQPVLSQLQDVFAALRSPGRETLNVSLTPSFGLEIVTPRIDVFLKQNPQYLVNFFTRLGDIDIEEEEGLDAAVVAGEPRSKAGRPELLCSPTYHPYISTALMPQGLASDLSALYRFKLVGLLRQEDAWPEYLGQLGLVFAPDMISANHSMLSTVGQAVLNGSGIALLPGYVADKHVEAGRMRRVHDVPYRARNSSYYLISKKSVRERPVFLRFRAWLMELGRSLESGEAGGLETP